MKQKTNPKYAVVLALTVISQTISPLIASEPPKVDKQMPTVKKEFFSKHIIKVEDIPVDSPFPAAPSPGVHPRILITPNELPALRERLKNTACGRRSITAIRSWLGCIYSKNGALKDVFEALVKGSPNALMKTNNSWWRNQIGLALCLASFDAMIKNDKPLGEKIAKALVTYAEIAGGKITPYGHKSVNPDTGLGYAYDFLYNFMTDKQRQAVRSVIAEAIKGKKSHGMDMNPEDRTYNWMPHGMGLILLALAIEGEDGYDPSIYTKSVEVMKDFLTYGIYPDGVPRECMHYFNFGMGSAGSEALVAMAKRGDNLFGRPYYHKLRNWYVHSIEPFGYAFSMHGDTSNDSGGLLSNYVLMKKVFPNDPVVDFYWRNRIHDNYDGLSYRGDFLFAALFGEDWKGGDSTEKTPKADQWGVDNAEKTPEKQFLKSWDPAVLKLPLSLYSPYRGFMITRTGWNKDAMVMHFECRRDALGPGHNHANQNDFTLSALGRKWAVELGFAICETKQHSCVLIDGKGQGCFAAPGIITAYLDTPVATFATGDAKDAYTYRHTFSWRTGNKENKGFNWQKTDHPSTAKALDNPVRYAYRTAMMLRGKYPYVLILDDIQKDSKEHLYEWLMQVPKDLILKSVVGNNAILASQDATKESPELFVSVLEQKQTEDMALSDAVEPLRLETFLPKRSPNSGSDKVFKLSKKLVLGSRSVAPNYKVMLYPFLPGGATPEVEKKENQFTIKFPDQVDVYTFEKQKSGQEAFSLVRNGGSFILVSGLHKFRHAKLSFKLDPKSDAPNIALKDDALYISGTGWKTIDIKCSGVKKIVSDDSVVKVETIPNGFRLIETL